ncbi:unnamed protein product [Larinioides sclopetarius]|uniref:histone acetyltransferase n=1 Tax=Larinioides sclopetarius TaxID=280406 RepID=A0AAV2BU45_9ARAC
MGLPDLEVEMVRKFLDRKRCPLSNLTRNTNTTEMDSDNGFHFTERGMIPGNLTISKDWHLSFPQNFRYHFVYRMLKEVSPTNDVRVFQDKSLDRLIAYAIKLEGDAYENANSREEYRELIVEQIFKIQKEQEEYHLKRKEMQMQQKDDPWIEPILGMGGQPKDFSNEKVNYKEILLARRKELFQTRERDRVTAKALFLLKKQVEARRNKEKTKDYDQTLNKTEQMGNALNRVKRMMEEKGILLAVNNLHFNQKTSPSELAKSVRDSDPIEERRYQVRREVATQRRNNQLRAANLNRGLVMDIDCQEACESDQTFDLTPLDEALPSVSHCKRAAGMKRRTLKLQDVVMNSMKENRFIRLATAEFCSMNPTAPGENR